MTELPYQVNKATLQERIAELVRDEKVEGICRHAGRVRPPGHAARHRAQARREADTVLAQLYKHTALQTAYPHQHARAGRRPAARAGSQAVAAALPRLPPDRAHAAHAFELNKAQARAHILEGLKIALDHLDAVIRTIRQSESAEKALRSADDALSS